MSHLGRPDGKVVENMRLKPAGVRLERILGEKILMLDECLGDKVKKSINDSKEKIVLLENRQTEH